MDIMQKRTGRDRSGRRGAQPRGDPRADRRADGGVLRHQGDAYGHGAVRLAREYEALGADWLAVSNIEEALQLRRAGVSLAAAAARAARAAAGQLAENNISQCAYSTALCAALSENAVRRGVAVKIHIKVDTGMSRLGFYFQDVDRDAAAVAEIAAACRLPGLMPEGIFTHFAVADGGRAGEDFTAHQLGCFSTLIEKLGREGITAPSATARTAARRSTTPRAIWTWCAPA